MNEIPLDIVVLGRSMKYHSPKYKQGRFVGTACGKRVHECWLLPVYRNQLSPGHEPCKRCFKETK